MGKIKWLLVTLIVLLVMAYATATFGATYEHASTKATLETVRDEKATNVANLQATLTSVVSTAQAPTPTLSAIEKENLAICEAWRFDMDAAPVIIRNNSDMAALSLHFALSAKAASACASIDPSFNGDVDLYLSNVIDTLEILSSWLIEEE